MSLSATFIWQPYVSTYARRCAVGSADAAPDSAAAAARGRICTRSDKAWQSNRNPPARQPAGSAADAEQRLALDGGHVVGGEVGGHALARLRARVHVGLPRDHHVGDDRGDVYGG